MEKMVKQKNQLNGKIGSMEKLVKQKKWLNGKKWKNWLNGKIS